MTTILHVPDKPCPESGGRHQRGCGCPGYEWVPDEYDGYAIYDSQEEPP